MNRPHRNPICVVFLNYIAIIIAYYLSILLHEWGHGTLAWIYGVKNTPFDIQYGGWFLLNVDEHVNYTQLIESGHGIAAALIGIAGCSVSFLFVIAAFIMLNNKHLMQSTVKFTFIYWFLIINMIPLVQYLCVSTFSTQGDTGRFIHGLNISGWWLFVPGALFIIYAIWRIVTIEIVKAYTVIPIKSVVVQNIFLLVTLGIVFLFIYTHGYNPFTDKGMDLFSKTLAIFSIIAVPVLFMICSPVRDWVKKAIQYRN
jgi:hypothetical protein